MGETYETADDVEAAIASTRRALRTAARQRDEALQKRLRSRLRHLNELWDEKAELEDQEADPDAQRPSRRPAVQAKPEGGAASGHEGPARPLLPAREQVHQVLSLLSVPAAPKLITAVHGAFFSGDLPASRLASLRRDEERSYRASPNARPYYLCPALTADHLAPARALLTVSTWPLEQRIIGGYSPRVDFLTAAIKIVAAITAQRQLGEWATDTTMRAERLLRSFAVSIPGALPPAVATSLPLDPEHVAKAAHAELAVHAEADQYERAGAAARARQQLTDPDRLFGTRLTLLNRQESMGP